MMLFKKLKAKRQEKVLAELMDSFEDFDWKDIKYSILRAEWKASKENDEEAYDFIHLSYELADLIDKYVTKKRKKDMEKIRVVLEEESEET